MRRLKDILPAEESQQKDDTRLQREILHEIKNKLCPIMAYSKKLKDEETQDEKRVMLEAIHRSAQLLKKFVGLLSDTESSQEFYQYTFEETELKRVIRPVVDEMGAWAAERGIEVRACLDSSPTKVQLDSTQFSNALTNLVKNAIEASEKGMTVTVRTTVATGGKIRIDVQDEGSGIPKGLESRIFSPGFSTKPGKQNSGLGLSVVRKIVEDHQGRLVLMPTDSGSLFRVFLPLVQPESAHCDLMPKNWFIQSPISLHAHQDNKEQAEVLLVDDDPEMLRAMYQLLKDRCAVTCAQMGQDALEWVKRKDFDRVVVDLSLKDMSGQDIYNKLKARNRKLSEKILFITGSREEGEVRHFLDSTGQKCLFKPFDVDTFVREVIPHGMPKIANFVHSRPEEAGSWN